MLYILWSLLNIGLFLFFIITSFRATKLIKERFGLFAALIFVFGLLSFINNPNNNQENHEPNSNKLRTWKFDFDDAPELNSTDYLDIELEKTIISKYELGIEYGKAGQTQHIIPISANSRTTGFISGTNWKPSSIIVNKTGDNNRLDYSVSGIVEWRLLGLTVYSQPKEYKGSALIK